MRITESKLRRIIRRVLSEGEGDGLNDPQVEEAYYELQNMSPSDFAPDADLSFLDKWPYSEARDILADEEAAEYEDYEEDTDEARYSEMEDAVRARQGRLNVDDIYDGFQGRGMYESLKRILNEHLHGYKNSYWEPYMVRELPPEASQWEHFGEWKEEFDLTKEAIEKNYREMTNISIDFPKMNTRNVDEDELDYKHYHEMTSTEKYVYCKNELPYLWEDLKRLWSELDEELGISDGFAFANGKIN